MFFININGGSLSTPLTKERVRKSEGSRSQGFKGSSEKCNSWLFMVIRRYLLWEERFMVKSVIYGYSWLFMVNSRRL